YAYAASSPTNYTDPTGKYICWECLRKEIQYRLIGRKPFPLRAMIPKTFGVTVDAMAEAGHGWGGSAVSGGFGVAGSRNQVADMSSAGAATTQTSYADGVPQQDPRTTGTLGAFAGAGQSFFFSNGEPSDLAGPFKNFSVNFGIGPISGGVTVSFGD